MLKYLGLLELNLVWSFLGFLGHQDPTLTLKVAFFVFRFVAACFGACAFVGCEGLGISGTPGPRTFEGFGARGFLASRDFGGFRVHLG